MSCYIGAAVTVPLQLTQCFGQNYGQVKYEGQRVVNAHECHTYLETRVNPRLTDQENVAQVEADLRDLATTDMETETIERLLRSTSPVKPWEVGEAMAECLLEDFYGVIWPWNMERDKRTPRASLPGADLVGFWQEGDDVYLVLGEVKTSEDIHTPPNNMTGRSGMIKQLEGLVHNHKLHFCLMKWLSPRCKGTRFEPL